MGGDVSLMGWGVDMDPYHHQLRGKHDDEEETDKQPLELLSSS